MTLALFILIQYQSMTYGQTHRQTFRWRQYQRLHSLLCYRVGIKTQPQLTAVDKTHFVNRTVPAACFQDVNVICAQNGMWLFRTLLHWSKKSHYKPFDIVTPVQCESTRWNTCSMLLSRRPANVLVAMLSPAKSLQATQCVGFAATFVGDGYTSCAQK